jgi:cob(I)alamin adenosyltransferase
MKIYTRTGDLGETGLFGGERTSKDSARIRALGEIDEANAALGLAKALGLPEDLSAQVSRLQSRLFDLGADLSASRPTEQRITSESVRELEAAIDRFDAELEPLRNFILPGGSPGAASLHLARAVCRRAERAMTLLRRESDAPDASLAFVNRLSDLLFVMARLANRRAGIDDPLWNARGGDD